MRIRSNCHFRAWQKLVTGEAKWMCIRRTRYARLHRLTKRAWWKPLSWIGIALQWIGVWITFLGWLLRWGGWYHACWELPTSKKWEFVPDAPKRRRVLPPVIFTGTDRPMKPKPRDMGGDR